VTPPELTRPLLNRVLFQPPDPPWKRSPRAAGLDYRKLDIETADGESLRGWWIEARARRRGHLLFFHGNAEDISDCIPDARLLVDIGFDVLFFDYRGYGGNRARPSEKGTYLDAEAALLCMLSQPRIDRDRIFYFGRSLGGAIALKLACEHPPAGLVLLSTFASVREVAPNHIPDALIPDAYPSLRRIKNLRAPLLVLHGDADEVVPLSQGEMLFKAARKPKKMHVFVDRDHNDVMDGAGDELAEVIVAWHKGLPVVKPGPT
jgi:fermentation-respiration switch protein FrsA (DUF1100 family)